MNTTSFLKRLLAPLATVVFLASGCAEKEVAITGFELNKTDVQLRIGETQQLIGIITPEEAAIGQITWTSDNEAAATVSTDGLVTAVAVGEATITATVENRTATCKVTVISSDVESIQLNKIELELAVGASEKLEATVSPEDADASAMIWSSSDESVATVSEDGTITAVALGEADITASIGQVKATCAVTVVAAEVESITLDKTEAEILKDETLQLTATVTPEGTGNEVTWHTSDDRFATVEDGLVTAIKVGTATITAKCAGKSASCTITILPVKAESITIDPTSLTIAQGEKAAITATVEPANYDGAIEWTSSDESIAIVNSEGEVTGAAAGNAVITASINGFTAQCSVQVTAGTGAVTIGDYFYSDGTWSSELDPAKTPIAIVFWTGDATATDPTLKAEHPECTHGLAIALGEKETCWWDKVTEWTNNHSGLAIYDWIRSNAPEYTTIKQTGDNCSPMTNIQGYNNTKALEFFNENNQDSPVQLAQYAVEYRDLSAAPSNTSGWYIPSPKEMSLCITGEWDGENLMDLSIMGKVDVRNLVNSKLEAIEGASPLNPGNRYWSSAMSNNPTACCFDMNLAWMTIANAASTEDYISGGKYVARCILAF